MPNDFIKMTVFRSIVDFKSFTIGLKHLNSNFSKMLLLSLAHINYNRFTCIEFDNCHNLKLYLLLGCISQKSSCKRNLHPSWDYSVPSFGKSIECTIPL